MRSIANYLLSCTLLILPGADMCCDEANEVVFTISRTVSFTVNSASSSYSQNVPVDITNDVLKALSDEDLNPNKVQRIDIESITYTVRQNNSADNTAISFAVQVGPAGSTNPANARPFANDAGVVLEQIEGNQQQPELSIDGVQFLNNVLHTAFVAKTGRAAFTAFLDGTAVPAPPPSLSFTIDVVVTLSGVAVQNYDCFLEPDLSGLTGSPGLD
jgi:hypothetical protein